MESQPKAESFEYAPDAVDEELASLPEPPRAGKWVTLALLGATVAASVAMVAFLASDAVYALAPAGATPEELGDLRTAAATAFAPNAYVSGGGMLGAAGAIRFERTFEGDSFRVAPVAGRSDVWVELRVPEGVVPDRYVPPTRFQGRLVPFAAAGPRHRGLAHAVGELTGQEVPKGAWLLVDGESPKQARWALVLVLVFAGFAAWNAFAIGKLVKRVG